MEPSTLNYFALFHIIFLSNFFMPSWLLSHSTPCSPIISVITHSFLCSFACPSAFALLVHIHSVFHMSALYLACADRRGFRLPVQPFGIPCHSQLCRGAPLSIPSRNNLRHTCLLQPSALVELSSSELSSMLLWFADLLLFIYLFIYFLGFVRA